MLDQATVETEQTAIGAMLTPPVHPTEYDDEPRPRSGGLKPGDFAYGLHQRICAAVIAAETGLTEHSVGGVLAYLGNDPDLAKAGGPEYLRKCSHIVDYGLWTTPEDMAAAVRELRNKRTLAEIAREASDHAVRMDKPAQDVAAEISRQLEQLSSDTDIGLIDYRDVLLAEADRLEQPAEYWSTGLPTLDEALGGGIYAGRFYAFAARMKVGKTMFLGSLAQTISHHVPVLYLALEMGATQIAQRMVAADLGRNSIAFVKRDEPSLAQRVRNFARTTTQQLQFADRPRMAFDPMKRLITAAVRKHGIRVVVVDYWQLVTGQDPRGTKVQHLAEVADWMAATAKALNVAIITACQTNREGETRDGDGLRMAVDWYAQLHKKTEPDSVTHSLWIDVESSRYTVSGSIGDEDSPPFKIDTIGPRIVEWGQ